MNSAAKMLLIMLPILLPSIARAESNDSTNASIESHEEIVVDPILSGRLRYESVDQPTSSADALTLRLRAGVEIKHLPSHLSVLAEAEGTMGLVNDYNAFPFAIVDNQRRPQYSVVADPQSIEVNRFQIEYKTKRFGLTVGRQRINLDEQRWVGSVGWRQNEQTFDAIRGEASIGPVSLDAIYSNSQRTIFGSEAGPRVGYGGDFLFLGAGVKAGPVVVKGFAYLLNYDEAFFYANSSQTYGARATTAFKLGPRTKLALAASYAGQSDYKTNPFNYAADYVAAEASLGHAGLTATAGYEQLGSDNGHPVQTPMATLHKFDGWADVFLTTPAAGLQDIYGGVSFKFAKVKALPGLHTGVTFHRFKSDVGSMHYGDEWDALAGFKLHGVALLVKFADYNAKGFGVDTRKLWFQAEFGF